MPGVVNRVRERREALGLSQAGLATQAQLTRQSVSSIEGGRSVPSVEVALRLAKVLGCRVESLFGAPSAEPDLNARAWEGVSSGRVALAHVGGGWVSYALEGRGLELSADGIRVGAGGTPDALRVEPLRSAEDLRQNLVLMGCATALGLLADRLNRHGGAGRFRWLSASNSRASAGLKSAATHVAGVHVSGALSGEQSEGAPIGSAGPPGAASGTRILLGHWEAGWVTRAGNPKGLRGVADLCRRGVRWVSRENGSGARDLLDRQLKQAGLEESQLKRPEFEASGHAEAAQAVSLGAADAGLATRDVAIGYGLNFIPVEVERYELHLLPSAIEDVRVERLLDVMVSGPFRRELTALGYDVSSSGKRLSAEGTV